VSYGARFVLGLLLMAVGVAAVGWSIYELTQIGTCASGGPYVSRRECPSDTPYYVAGIFAGVVVWLIGAWAFATRGRHATEPGLPPSHQSPPRGAAHGHVQGHEGRFWRSSQ
jgi:hypothetical protein